MGCVTTLAVFYTRKRTLKKAHRKAVLLARREATEARDQIAVREFGPRSKIIKLLARYGRPVNSKVRSGIAVTLPSVFSFIDAPETVIAGLSNFALAIRTDVVRNVAMDFRKVQSYDLAASALLDVLVVELQTQARTQKRKISWRGTYPKDPAIARFIRALGIINHLEIEHLKPPPEEAVSLRVFDRRKKHYSLTAKPQEADFKTKVIHEFVQHINSCLHDHQRALSAEARHELVGYTDEIVDNAEEHAVMMDWTIQAYLDNSLVVPTCEIVIFNFGKTIAETLANLPDGSYTKSQIAPIFDHHRKHKMFGSNWAENDLLTLLALQGLVSSKNRSDKDTRGNGTTELIEFFLDIHKDCAGSGEAKMALVSGSTYIKFDGRYRMSRMQENGPQLIAFNKANDLMQLPDPKCVRGLKGLHFPGTVISIRFPLTGTSAAPVIE